MKDFCFWRRRKKEVRSILGSIVFYTHVDVLEAYCRKLETTKVWGGEVELRALANAFQVNIQIFAANRAMLMHESKDTPMATLRLSFHEHYYALGAHYNSIH